MRCNDPRVDVDVHEGSKAKHSKAKSSQVAAGSVARIPLLLPECPRHVPRPLPPAVHTTHSFQSRAEQQNAEQRERCGCVSRNARPRSIVCPPSGSTRSPSSTLFLPFHRHNAVKVRQVDSHGRRQTDTCRPRPPLLHSWAHLRSSTHVTDTDARPQTSEALPHATTTDYGEPRLTTPPGHIDTYKRPPAPRTHSSHLDSSNLANPLGPLCLNSLTRFFFVMASTVRRCDDFLTGGTQLGSTKTRSVVPRSR
jgi:hypothetical protein